MKHSGLRALTAFSAIALVAGAIQPANAATVSAAKAKKPAAPAIASVTETTATSKGKKKFANVVVAIEAPAAGVTRTLVTAKGAKSCTIKAPQTSCTISKVAVGKKLTISAKSKTARSGYGTKSTNATYTVGNVDSVSVKPSAKASANAPTSSTIPAPDVAPPSEPSPSNDPAVISTGTIEVGTVTQSNVIDFWTPTRLDDANTRELVFDKGAKSARVESVRKGGGSGGSTTKGPKQSTTTSTGKSWTAGGLPLAATGKVFFTFGSSTYVCSGSVVTDDKTDRSIVLTAGHCVYDQASSQFASNWIFIPAYDSKPKGSCTDPANPFPYGCWTARSLMVHSDFSSQTSFNAISTQSDWAFAVIGANASGAQLDATVGSFAFNESGLTATNQAAYAFGYPAASPYSGADLVYCNGNIFADTNNSSATWGLACNMTGGSSGGPWMSAFSTSTNSGALSSVNSYKYSNDSTKMYGPKFDSRTRSTLNAALSVS
jgi:hypothetical protein